jgi:hypothetical protein
MLEMLRTEARVTGLMAVTSTCSRSRPSPTKLDLDRLVFDNAGTSRTASSR